MLKVGSEDLSDVDFEANQQQVVDILGEEGFTQLKGSLQTEIRQLPKSTDNILARTLLNRRRAMADEDEQVDTFDMHALRKNRDDGKIKLAVEKFISFEPQRESKLLEVGKMLKHQEDEVDRKLEEARKLADAQMIVERARELEEKQRQAEERKALEVQTKLQAMGVKRGEVDQQGVKQAEAEKKQVIEEVSAKKSDLQQADNFISSLDELLDNKLLELQEAESLRVAALEAAASAPPAEEVQAAAVPVEVEVAQPEELQTEALESVSELPAAESLSIAAEEVQAVSQPEFNADSVAMGEPSIAEEPEEVPIVEPVKSAPPGLSPAERAKREAMLSQFNFDKRLQSIASKAQLLFKQGHNEAANEALSICTKLVNGKEDFLNTANPISAKQFIEIGNEAMSPSNTKHLSQSRGRFWDAIIKFKQVLSDALSGISPFESSKSSAKRIEEMRDTLKMIKTDGMTDKEEHIKATGPGMGG